MVGPLELEAQGPTGMVIGRWSLNAPFAVIGRDPRNDVTLDDDQVSRRHVYLQVVAGGVFWIDLDSRSGVVRGGIAEPSGWLSLSDAIGIGPFQLRLAGGVRPASEEDLPLPNPLVWRVRDVGSAESVTLEFATTTAGVGKRFAVSRVLTLVGTSGHCRVRIADDRSSRFYTALIRTAGEVWVVDLLSQDGIRVNKARTRWSRLSHGDTLDFGTYRVGVRLGDLEGSSVLRPFQKVSLPAIVAQPALPAPGLVAADDPAGLLVRQFGQLQQQMFDQYQQAIQAMLALVGSMHRDQMGQIHQELERIREITQELQRLQAHEESPALALSGPGDLSARPSPATPPSDVAFVPRKPSPVPDKESHARLSHRIATLQNERQSRWQKILNVVNGINGG